MSKLSILCGTALILIGAIGYFATGATHGTALIPAALGLIIMICGVIGVVWEGARKHAMHGALVVALLGAFGSSKGSTQFFYWILGTAPERPAAVIAQVATSFVCLLLLVVGVRSFIAARRARAEQKSPQN